jgi:hypothetical protein
LTIGYSASVGHLFLVDELVKLLILTFSRQLYAQLG